MSKISKKIILLVLLLITLWAGWRIILFLPDLRHEITLLFPHRVRLHSAVYLRSANIHPHDPASYDPAQGSLASEWVQLSIEREENQAFFESSAGEKIRVELGKPHWVKGCENLYQMESFPLAEGLSLGSIAFKQPELIVVCDFWPAGQKIRPGRVVIREGPIPENGTFFFEMDCNTEEVPCLAFAEAVGEVVGMVVDAETGETLPAARITLSSGMGVQEYTGSFRMPVYVNLQVAYQISLPGYVDQVGEIRNFYGNKLDIMYFTNADHSRGTGGDIDLLGYGQPVEYTFKLSRK